MQKCCTDDAFIFTYFTSVINSQPAVRFDGLDDYLDDAYNYSARTVFIVYLFPDITGQNNEDLGQLWGSYADEIHFAIDSRSSRAYGYSFDGTGASGFEGRFSLNGNSYSSFFANGKGKIEFVRLNISNDTFTDQRNNNIELIRTHMRPLFYSAVP